jgi:hypothetical protein
MPSLSRPAATSGEVHGAGSGVPCEYPSHSLSISAQAMEFVEEEGGYRVELLLPPRARRVDVDLVSLHVLLRPGTKSPLVRPFEALAGLLTVDSPLGPPSVLVRSGVLIVRIPKSGSRGNCADIAACVASEAP